MNYKIGVFDSGLGGRYVAQQIKARPVETEIILKTDRKHFPYGNKSPTQLIGYLRPVIKNFEAQGVDGIIIACNTVTANVWHELKGLTKLPIFGMKLPLEQASKLSQTKVAIVCATTATLASKRYRQLKDELARDLKLIEPDCSQWASLIEAGNFGDKQLLGLIKTASKHQADVIVLGCSHYFWFAEHLRQLGDDLTIIEPTEAVIDELLATLSSRATVIA